MKRFRNSKELVEQVNGEEGLDPLVGALLALGRQPDMQHATPDMEPVSKRARARKQVYSEDEFAAEEALEDEPMQEHQGRQDYVWRGLHRLELLQKQHHQPDAAAAAEFHNSSSRRSSNTHGPSSEEDEVAQQQQQQQQQQLYPQQQLLHPQQQQSTQPPPKQKQPKTQKLTKQQKRQQEQKDKGKEWAALTTWLRMNLHHPRTLKRVILFLGHQEPSTRSWVFELNPEVTWQEVGLETKLRLKTLLTEAETAYLQKYPGRAGYEWHSKVQKYTPPGSSETAEVPLWDVVNGLHQIYLQQEESFT